MTIPTQHDFPITPPTGWGNERDKMNARAEITEWPEVQTNYPLPFFAGDTEMAELREFKAHWEPVLTSMVPALVSIVQLATSMLPPAMQAMVPPEVREFVEIAERD